jgi:hypothetical protein
VCIVNPSLGYPAPPHAQFRLAKFTTLPEFPTPDYAVRFSFASMATLPDAVSSLKARMPDNLLDQIDAKAGTHTPSLSHCFTCMGTLGRNSQSSLTASHACIP